MSVARYTLGLLALAGMVAPLAVAAGALRRHLLPEWTGALAVLADVVATVAALAGVAQLLGAVGLFAVGPVVVACVVVGVATTVLVRRRSENGADQPHRPTPRVRAPNRVELAVAALACALVVAVWATWVDQAQQFGIGNGDSVWYHLPIAARFVQDGSLTNLHFLNGEALVTYYPANASLLHAIGMLSFGRDDLSLLLNFALLPLTLLAGWCIGRRWGVAPTAMTGVAVSLSLPIVAASQAGSAKDDVLSVAFLLAAVAFLVNAEGRRPALALSGVAAGFALGTKLTMFLPVLLLGAGVIVICRARPRRMDALAWWAGALATGSFWYVRNLVAIGNPVPSLALPGLPSPPTPSIDRYGPAVVEFIGDRAVWDRIFRPGLEGGLGIAWWAVLGMAAAGAVLAVVKGDAIQRLVGALGLSIGASFVFLPGTAFAVGVLQQRDAPGAALLIFVYNLRYLLPALALGLALLPAARQLEQGIRRPLVLVAYAAVLLVTESTESGLRSWAPGHGGAAVAAMLATVALFWVFALRGPPRRGRVRKRRRQQVVQRRRAALVTAAVLLVAAVPASGLYHRHRYVGNPLAAWAERIHDQHIAIAGFAGQYPLLGNDLSNEVQYLGQRGPDGAFSSFSSCIEWRRALRDGGFDYVATPTDVVTPTLGYDLARWRLGARSGEPPNEPRETAWNRTDRGLSRVFRRDGVTVYEVRGPASDRGC